MRLTGKRFCTNISGPSLAAQRNFMPKKAEVDLLQNRFRGLECHCGNLRRASRIVSQIYDNALRPIGLRSTQLTVLFAVLALEPASTRVLASIIVIDSTTLSRNLQVLKRRGLLQTSPGSDRREQLVCLTPKGRAILQGAFPLWDRAQDTIAQLLGDRHTDMLNNGLTKLIAASGGPVGPSASRIAALPKVRTKRPARRRSSS